MKRIMRALCLFLILAAAGACEAAQGDVGGESAARYKNIFGARDFKMNRDAVKNEIPENGAYKIEPRVSNSDIWTSFAIPDDAQLYPEWMVTARLRSSNGPAAGVGFETVSGGYAAYVFPDGKGTLECYDGRKTKWKSDFNLKNFAYPINISLWRDSNGSIIARAGGIVVAVRLLDADFKSLNAERVKSVFFVTHARGNNGGAAVYEALSAEGWGDIGLTAESN
ncbi:MAG: hypothetical protein LBT08_11210 [Synergistaceae bacterium]|nr:hypothetical protein [Synergistaceae bacterium]